MTTRLTHSRFLRALLCSIWVTIVFGGVFEDQNVKLLTDADLDDTLKNSTNSLVVFYAPWCGYCQQLSPKWSEVASELKYSKVLVAAIDAEENPNAAEEYGIEGLPTIKMITSSGGDNPSLKARDFAGMPETKAILRWVEKLTTGSPAPELKTKQDVELSREHSTSIIGVFEKFEGEAYEAFIDQALESEDGLAWYTTTDVDLVGVDSAPTLVFARNFPDTPLEVIRRPFARTEGRDGPGDELSEFVDTHKHPDYYAYDASGISTMMETLEYVEREYHVHVIVPPRLLKDKDFLRRAREAGRAVRDHAQLVLSVAGGDSEINDAFKIEKLEDEVQVFVAHTESIKKYSTPSPVKPEAFDADLLKDMMKSVQGGEDTYRVWASAIVPEPDTDEHGVKTAVRSTLDEIVGDKKKDVVVVSYVPEDEVSETGDYFLGILHGLADALKGIPSVQVVRFDSYANEHKLLEYPFEELPAVTVFPATEEKEKTPVLLEDHSSFSIKALGEFIHKHAGVKFELPSDLPDEDEMMGDMIFGEGPDDEEEDLGEDIDLADLGLEVKDGEVKDVDGEQTPAAAHEEL